MAYSTCCRVAMVSCLVLCVSLLLPRTFLSRGGGRQEPGAAPLAAPAPPEGKLGRFPPRMHYQATPDSRATPHFPRSHLAEAVAKAKAGGGGGGSTGGSGRGLVGQIIPIYGFGIFLYILYILFKLASKGKTVAGERKCPTAAPGNMKRKITDYELTQLQEKLRETEEAMEKLINRVGPNCDRTQNVTTDQEKRLLQQLREITRVMKEGKFIDGISPEKEAEEAPYMEDWEGYPEETYPVYDDSDCFKRKQDTILVDYPDLSQPSAEELAERMEDMEDEDHLCNETLLTELTTGRGGNALTQKKDEITDISEEERGLHRSQSIEECCCCYDDDDPAVIAENAGFHTDSCSEAEESTHEDLSVESENENAALKKQKACDSDETGTLRKRNTKGLE
ncbi:protein RIC-3 isoform X2 [Rissa tridactyla]|uniref:protein RIC-3 isoform X2 n=1 Tax=Rissa tridactyla TaxID=75485 RepID=UPI0023BA7201|nr:protein RIC-3 isoform X2 [Rissa tridactyla]